MIPVAEKAWAIVNMEEPQRLGPWLNDLAFARRKAEEMARSTPGLSYAVVEIVGIAMALPTAEVA